MDRKRHARPGASALLRLMNGGLSEADCIGQLGFGAAGKNNRALDR